MVATMDNHGWDQRFADNPQHFGAGPNTLLERHASELTPGSAADVGCGQGRNTAWLLGRGWDVTAVDFSEVALRHTREAAQAAAHVPDAVAEVAVSEDEDAQAEAGKTPKVEVSADGGETAAVAHVPTLTTVQTDVSEWHPEETFDLVVAAYLHLPAEKMAATWEHLVEITAPGGTLVVVGHDRDNEGNGPKDPDVLFHAADVVAKLPDTWTIEVAEAVDRGEGSIDALVVATAPKK